jgi:hypothetical protein
MKHADWRAALLDKLATSSAEGREAADLLRRRGTRIAFHRTRRNIGAFWTIFGNIRLNARLFDRNTAPHDSDLLALLLHEAVHLKQGPFTALSVRGELEAWQRQFRLLEKVGRRALHPALIELLGLPLNWDRANLRRGRELMQRYAGKGYRADLLPLFPIGKEILFWISFAFQGGDAKASGDPE